jgi:16S rRNA processing protein RimM
MMTATPERKDCLKIGKIVGFHGLKGDAKVRPADRDADWAENLKSVVIFDAKTGESKFLTISHCKLNGPHVLLRFTDYPDRTAAEPLMGLELYALACELPKPESNQFYANDLIGLQVFTPTGSQPCGVVHDMVSSTGSDFLELKLFENDQLIVVPFQQHFFPVVDLQAKRLTLDVPPGFIELPS